MRRVEVYLRRPVPDGHPALVRVLEAPERAIRGVPPRLPADLAEMDEASMLLSAYVNGPGLRKPSARELLRALVGKLPTDAAEAGAWKAAIKRRRRAVLARERAAKTGT